ncbi:MAG: fibronectin type III domain-containing protein, partial [Candidatus Nanopelagicaceae bacterium]
FTQSVTGLASSDFSLSGTGSSSCVVGTPSGSGTTYQVQLTGCSPGTVILTLAQNAVTNSSSQTGPSTATSASTVTIDQTSPTISSVTAPSNGTYSPTGLPSGSSLSFTVVMSESVTVSGSPRLTLTVGSVTRYATYLSQSDSRTLTFRYTPATSLDEIDADGIAMASNLDLNGGAITDLATNALSDTSLTPPTLTGVLIAQRASAPTITSITAGNTQLSVAFTPGDSNGAASTNYKYSLDGGSFTAFSPTATTTPLVITGLTNGTSYAVRILAVTSVGDGESSTAVTATPTSIVVANGSDISVTYGQTGISSAFTASGGTPSYSFSLSPSVAGVSIDPSTGVVTTSSSLAAGSYSTFVVATDSASRSGQKAISILVSQETPTISIALTGGVTTAPLGAAISIIASVSEEGSVAFLLGGSALSGCSAVASSNGEATCSWTPGSLGSVSLTAVLTPTDSANYLSETSSALSITVVTGTSAISLSLSGTPTKGATITITATTTDIAGSVAFFLNGTRIIGCKNKAVSSGQAICLWKLSRHGEQTLSARFTPTNTAYRASNAQVKVVGLRRVSR